MKALTDKIIEVLKEKRDEHIREGNNYRDLILGFEYAISEIKVITAKAEFEEVAREMMRYLAEKHHPHTTAIISSTDAELVEGIQAIHKCMDYTKD